MRKSQFIQEAIQMEAQRVIDINNLNKMTLELQNKKNGLLGTCSYELN